MGTFFFGVVCCMIFGKFHKEIWDAVKWAWRNTPSYAPRYDPGVPIPSGPRNRLDEHLNGDCRPNHAACATRYCPVCGKRVLHV